MEPNYYEAIFHRGNACREMNNYNQALLDFTKLLMLRNTAENYVNRARIYLEMNDNKNVLSDLFKAIQLDNNSYDAYYNRALVYHDKLEYDSAVSDFQKCMEIKPDNDDAYDKLTLLQKFMKTNIDTLNDIPKEFQSITENWTDDFRDTQIHVEHHEKAETNILVASRFKNDNGIKRVIERPVAENKVTQNNATQNNVVQNNNEQTIALDKTISEKPNDKEVQTENQKQNEPVNLLASNKTTDDNSTLQNNINKESSVENKEQIDPSNSNNLLASNIAVNNSSQNNTEADIQFSSNNNSSNDKTEQSADKEVNKATQMNEDNSSIDFNKIGNNATGQQNIEIATKSNSIHRTNNKHYAIQLGAFENEANAMVYEQKVKDVIDYDINTLQSSGLFKIRTGDYQLKDALSVVKKIRQSGFTDAIIVESAD